MQNMLCEANPTYYKLDLDTSTSHIEPDEAWVDDFHIGETNADMKFNDDDDNDG